MYITYTFIYNIYIYIYKNKMSQTNHKKKICATTKTIKEQQQ